MGSGVSDGVAIFGVSMLIGSILTDGVDSAGVGTFGVSISMGWILAEGVLLVGVEIFGVEMLSGWILALDAPSILVSSVVSPRLPSMSAADLLIILKTRTELEPYFASVGFPSVPASICTVCCGVQLLMCDQPLWAVVFL